MAEFEVNVIKIDDVIEHPDADRLTIVRIGGYRCIANKDEYGNWRYQPGDLVCYVPEGAVLPEWFLKKQGFWKDGKGTLAGSKGDRVKAIRLRGVVSQGLLYPVSSMNVNGEVEYAVVGNGMDDPTDVNDCIDVEVGTNVAEFLGIKKYDPPIPVHMSGEVWNAFGRTMKFDVENIQKFPGIFQEGEEVFVTEKLHGTFCAWGVDVDGNVIVHSKGLGAQGLAFKLDEKNVGNLYVRTLQATQDHPEGTVVDRLRKQNMGPVYVLGEIFGRGVQDLSYGQMTPVFRLFDVYVGEPGQGRFLDVDEKVQFARDVDVEMVPELYRGAFSWKKMEELRDGQDFSKSNIREGIVILPVKERRDDQIGRVQLKFVSPNYLLRKNGTELN